MMIEQAIPQNINQNFCDALTVSPIEYHRNSSLINNKLNKLNKSYEQYDEDCARNESILYDKSNEYIIDDEILDLENAENNRLFELSFDENDIYEFKEKINQVDDKIDLNKRKYLDETIESLENSFNKENNNSFNLNKSQKILHKNAKRRLSAQKKFSDENYKLDFATLSDEEDLNISNTDSSILFESFSLSESMVVSPIAHEMSQINGQELKDVSDLFSCDLSSCE